MSRDPEVGGIQVFGNESSRNMVLEFKGRYPAPQDNTTVLNVSCGRWDDGLSVLLERETFHHLAEWLEGGPAFGMRVLKVPLRQGVDTIVDSLVQDVRISNGVFEVHDAKASARITKSVTSSEEALSVSISWNGSSRSRLVSLDRMGTDWLTGWMTDTDAHGWERWGSGRADIAEA